MSLVSLNVFDSIFSLALLPNTVYLILPNTLYLDTKKTYWAMYYINTLCTVTTHGQIFLTIFKTESIPNIKYIYVSLILSIACYVVWSYLEDYSRYLQGLWKFSCNITVFTFHSHILATVFSDVTARCHQ